MIEYSYAQAVLLHCTMAENYVIKEVTIVLHSCFLVNKLLNMCISKAWHCCCNGPAHKRNKYDNQRGVNDGAAVLLQMDLPILYQLLHNLFSNEWHCYCTEPTRKINRYVYQCMSYIVFTLNRAVLLHWTWVLLLI